MSPVSKSVQEWPEASYRKRVQEAFDEISRKFDSVDPDQVECEVAFGALTITFSDKTKLILSAQPSVRQVWLALAAKGTAYHFDFHFTDEKWMDDKGKNIELHSFVREVVREKSGVVL